MGDIFHATSTYGKGFKPTGVPDEYSIKIYIGGFANSKHADERVRIEIATFMKTGSYVSYKITDSRYKSFLLKFYEYTIQFDKDPETSHGKTSSNLSGK